MKADFHTYLTEFIKTGGGGGGGGGGRENLDNNSSTTNDFLMKLYMHHHTMVIYTQCKFHEIPSIAYEVMAEDGKIH